ncbi:MAG TPA: asparagine synthase-related protein [bacterium]
MAGFLGFIQIDGAPLPEIEYRTGWEAAYRERGYFVEPYLSPNRDLCISHLHRSFPNPRLQPVASADGRFLLFLDGELFNEDLDLTDQPGSVLQAYLREGEALFSRLNGFFALALIEPEKHRLQLVTDRTASVPIFYLRRGNLLAFSPEIQPLLSLDNSPPKINPTALSNFLSSGSILEGKSLIGDIEILRPGQVLTVSGSQVRMDFYWQFFYAEKRDERDSRDLQEDLYQLMLRAVERQTKDNLPAAVTLSGGYDSRSILGCMRRLYPERDIRTVTWGEDQFLADSDAVVAERTARHYGTKHIFYTLRAAALPTHFREFVRETEGRVDAAGNYPESLHIFKRIRDELGVQILIRGNELFGARSKVTRDRQAWFTGFIPDLTTLPYSYSCLRPEIRRVLADLGCQQMQRLYRELPYDDPIDRKDHLFIAQRWPGYQSPLTQLKQRVIQERNPYLDNDLMDFVSRLPARYRTWKNLYVATVQQKMPEFRHLGASSVISLIDWDARLRKDRALQSFVQEILLERKNGFDSLMDRPRLVEFLEQAFKPKKTNRRSLGQRAQRRWRRRLDRFELEASLEIFRLMIVKIWADEFMKGEFPLESGGSRRR